MCTPQLGRVLKNIVAFCTSIKPPGPAVPCVFKGVRGVLTLELVSIFRHGFAVDDAHEVSLVRHTIKSIQHEMDRVVWPNAQPRFSSYQFQVRLRRGPY